MAREHGGSKVGALAAFLVAMAGLVNGCADSGAASQASAAAGSTQGLFTGTGSGARVASSASSSDLFAPVRYVASPRESVGWANQRPEAPIILGTGW